ncbi:DUF4124 domain-containing protein [Chromobacterium subtsugae]|uniref:DUF4124 domain-containing protein n=1 Tax=Chromobacterium subtsugae TaxID=251747 RepID=A0ABS7F8P6_9NEIS|nr:MULTISPECIES: DUF4124 domain-containing protein [Chromobacterium]KUM05287.1 hypothetical protein Cv017_09835 [Chromobacterium subtsugae]KZE86575.1 hypothetical protein AWB61_00380 [Chromobacterium sp. F49]MBW7565013.1 DUF4124 domain-containing protein [Chromobacterium subtsugae]MBW8286460.1 DUF4124 domain-containing protein [Chromobacterium subtsugae]WSE91497.1 DUF4124 domain-containing protein [Chromobacterium subtsugae]
MTRLAGLFTLLSCAAAFAGGALYKWVDDAGRVHYSDSPPLQSQSGGVAELNKQGSVRKPAESDAQRKAREASAAAALLLQQRQQDAARHDQALIQSYPSLADLKADRERQLSVLQSAYHALELRAQGLLLQQRDLQKDLDLSAKLRQPPHPSTTHNLQALRHEQLDLDALIRAKRGELDAFRRKMQQDIQRYQQLNAR